MRRVKKMCFAHLVRVKDCFMVDAMLYFFSERTGRDPLLYVNERKENACGVPVNSKFQLMMTRDVCTSLVGYSNVLYNSHLSSKDYYVHLYLPLRKFLRLGIQRKREKLILEEELFNNLQCVVWILNTVSNGSRIAENFIIISTLYHILSNRKKVHWKEWKQTL